MSRGEHWIHCACFGDLKAEIQGLRAQIDEVRDERNAAMAEVECELFDVKKALQTVRDERDAQAEMLKSVAAMANTHRERAQQHLAALGAGQQQETALQRMVEQFIARCRDIREGSPNAFYQHVDTFCNLFEVLHPPKELT